MAGRAAGITMANHLRKRLRFSVYKQRLESHKNQRDQRRPFHISSLASKPIELQHLLFRLR